jgi:hypothetical protein
MRIKMKALCAGPEGVLSPEQVVEVDKVFGQALVAGGYAVEMGSESSPAAAPKAKREKATVHLAAETADEV